MTAIRKPHRTAFLWQEVLLPSSSLAVVALVVGLLGTQFIAPWVAPAVGGVWMLLTGFLFAQGAARFRKEEYEVHADRIVVRRGGLLSDEELEVHYPHITHVKWIRPWLRSRIFGVGTVYVEVAGSGTGTIALRDIMDSEIVQSDIRGHLHGPFSMSTRELLHEEKPAGEGIILDLVLKAGWGAVVLVFALGSELFPLLATGAIPSFPIPPALLFLGLGVGILGWLGLLTLRFLDLKRRRYRVYDGVIEYQEGFLTRNDAFMPVENLSNSEVTRGIAERVTNLHNVVVSCQGAGQEVAFLYLRNGPALNRVLDGLIDRSESPVAPTAGTTLTEATVEGDAEAPVASAGVPPPPEAVYRMHAARTLVPMLLYVFMLPVLLFAFPLLIVLLINIGRQVIRLLRTTYILRKNSVEETFSFINVQHREFSKDKITGVVFRENPFDRMFGTITIQFWSIGAGREIVFRNVRKDADLITAVCERAGIHTEESVGTIGSEFSVGRFLCANFPLLVLNGLLMLAALVAGAYLHPAYALFLLLLFPLPLLGLLRGFLYYPRSSLGLYRDCVVFQRGLITRIQTCARYQNIKDTTTLKYPVFDSGHMRFNVAGERVAENNASAAVPYGFTMCYLPDILRKDEWFDYEVLAGTSIPTLVPEEVVEARKAISNSVVRTLLVSTILFPFLLLLPITLPWFAWRASLVRYRIEPGRVLMRRGRLYRRQTSILFDRIDHIQTGEGALNKLFKNGNIVISTAGSSRPELVLVNVKGHQSFYQTLRARHQ